MSFLPLSLFCWSALKFLASLASRCRLGQSLSDWSSSWLFYSLVRLMPCQVSILTLTLILVSEIITQEHPFYDYFAPLQLIVWIIECSRLPSMRPSLHVIKVIRSSSTWRVDLHLRKSVASLFPLISTLSSLTLASNDLEDHFCWPTNSLLEDVRRLSNTPLHWALFSLLALRS